MGINQMRIVGKDNAIAYIYCRYGILYNLLSCYGCNFCKVNISIAGQKPLALPMKAW